MVQAWTSGSGQVSTYARRLLSNKAPVGRHNKIVAERRERRVPSPIVDRAKNTHGATRPTIPMDFDFDLVGGTRVASELYDLRLAEQSDEFLVRTLTIGLEVLSEQCFGFFVIHRILL